MRYLKNINENNNPDTIGFLRLVLKRVVVDIFNTLNTVEGVKKYWGDTYNSITNYINAEFRIGEKLIFYYDDIGYVQDSYWDDDTYKEILEDLKKYKISDGEIKFVVKIVIDKSFKKYNFSSDFKHLDKLSDYREEILDMEKNVNRYAVINECIERLPEKYRYDVELDFNEINVSFHIKNIIKDNVSVIKKINNFK